MTANLPAPVRVSVIIPTKNRSALLRQALASVRALDGPDLELEVIVADNGSTDETEAVAREFGARFVQTLTAGAAAARNVGLRAASGNYLAFLDDDDIWLPGHVRPHLALLAARPNLAAVVGQVRNTDHSLSADGAPWPERLPADGDLFETFLQYYPQIGATIARVTVLDSVGYLDETLLSDEDWDWHLRLALRHQIGFVPVPCVRFRQRPSGTKDELQRFRLPYFRRVFWHTVQRAGNRRPSVRTVTSFYLRHSGAYASHLLSSASSHVAVGRPALARRAILWATEASPLHVLWSVARSAAARRTVWAAFTAGAHRRRTRPAVPTA